MSNKVRMAVIPKIIPRPLGKLMACRKRRYTNLEDRCIQRAKNRFAMELINLYNDANVCHKTIYRNR